MRLASQSTIVRRETTGPVSASLRMRPLRNERNETVKWFLHVSTEIDKRDSLRRFPDNYVPLVR